LILIVFKIILWDNVLAMYLQRGAMSQVAYSAHLGGYLFGFLITLMLLSLNAVPRQHFDALALINRWRRRTGLMPSEPISRPARLRARAVDAEELASRPLGEPVAPTPWESMREAVCEALVKRRFSDAMDGYFALLQRDPDAVLSAARQVEIGNLFTQHRRYAEAARAYENLLRAYPGAREAAEVRLMLGILYRRYLGRADLAAEHIRDALPDLSASQRLLAEEVLREAERPNM
jgi:tetratricopeptide (TPR) repeat protein